MNERAVAPVTDALRLLQNAASDPRVSAWVSANAGSGKTFVLARRVVRLLLAGADPARLLCLTFTKAAAAEMAKRVFKTLAEWVQLSDAGLAAALADLEDRPPTPEQMARARKLFARALETPGGLKIQTIHAFCERLLHQFPFEANVAGHFEVLEETAANVLLAQARRRVLARAALDPEGELGRALRLVVLSASDIGHEAAIAEVVEKREAYERWLGEPKDLRRALAELRTVLGLDGGDDATSVHARITDEAAFGAADIVRLIEQLERGGVYDQQSAERFRSYLEASPAERADRYLGCFMKKDGEPRAPSRVASTAVQGFWPDLDQRISAEQRRLEDLGERVSAAKCFALSEALFLLADAVVADYDRVKRFRGYLDFDDLVRKTTRLLTRSEASQWVHYKIDQGLDHILLDEAQDTSPAQWELIQALADDFFAGEDAHPTPRTLFAVGDEKQSIYSFQGAVPAWFSRVKQVMRRKAEGAGRAFRDVGLHVSFRSTPDILGAVDTVFASPDAWRGVVSEGERFPPHEARRRGEPGLVTIWPMVEAPPEPEPGAWEEPLDHLGNAAPEVVLANRIAMTIRAWLDPAAPERLAADGRPIRPGGILILARKRGPLSESINRALKAHGVPVAGADRLALAGHIAVLDLLALADVVLQDRDDLQLAAVLRSPLFGLDEEALFALAHDRRGSLWLALREAADAEPFESAWKTLDALRDRADFVGPYQFFAEMLGARGGRKRFAARLGVEAEDVLDEFLAQALAYERTETPSLQGFVAWMRAAATEIRRETEILRDEVRVMTVHGAKGLEADVVFLVDDGGQPVSATHDPHILVMTDNPDEAIPAPLVWARGSRPTPAVVKAVRDRVRERSEEEYRRLLYVGLTRAKDRLIVCGTKKERITSADRGWHGLVSKALMPAAAATTAIDGSEAFEWRSGGGREPAPPAGLDVLPAPSGDLPEWLGRRVAPLRAPKLLRPSAALSAELPAFAGRATLAARMSEGSAAMERGRLLHRLLEALPEHPEANRRTVAGRYLAAVKPDWTEAQRRETVAEVMAVLERPDFAAVFAPGSRAEIDVAGRVATARGTEALAGRIDRLAVTPERVLVTDYKTNRRPPTRLAEVPETYVAQLALYRIVLRRLYPERAVAAALLWTAAPALMEVPEEMLEAMAGRITTAFG